MSVAVRSEPTPPVLAVDIQGACAALGISWKTWNEEVAPHVRLVRFGRATRVPVAELLRYLDEHAELTLDGG